MGVNQTRVEQNASAETATAGNDRDSSTHQLKSRQKRVAVWTQHHAADSISPKPPSPAARLGVIDLRAAPPNDPLTMATSLGRVDPRVRAVDAPPPLL